MHEQIRDGAYIAYTFTLLVTLLSVLGAKRLLIELTASINNLASAIRGERNPKPQPPPSKPTRKV